MDEATNLSPGNAPAVHFENLTFTYKRADGPALADVNLRIESGRFVGLIGRNGAGKSTLARCVNGIVPKFVKGKLDGRVSVLGRDVARETVARMTPSVGIVFQDFETQIFSTGLMREIAFVMENLGRPRDEMREAVERWVDRLDLRDLLGREPSTLSGGQKQRLALASILAAEPPILVLDEPTTDLDPISAAELLAALKALAHSGRTILFITHELDFLRDADEIAVLDQGRLVAHGAADAVLGDGPLLERHGLVAPALSRLAARLRLPRAPRDVDDAEALIRQAGYDGHPENLADIDARNPPLGDTVLSVSGVRFGYRPEAPVLEGVDLSVPAGMALAILGQNGSGKTTLMRNLVGIVEPWDGEIVVDGRDVASMSAAQRATRIGMVFQNPDHQIFCASAAEEVAFGVRQVGVAEEAIDERVAEALAFVGLSDEADADPFSMDKGRRKKLALASVLACRPKVILLDEPTTGLDVLEQEAMMNLLLSLCASGHAVIFITHHVELAMRYAREIRVMHEGRLRAIDNTDFADGELMAATRLTPPPMAELSRRFGYPTARFDELLMLLGAEDE
ncbi:MAG: ABC transporter ATP-binding protein [Deltaproteobacteria bacterium]|nr:ABC transporter ATP-binding protein [Deltaproteobacteria bacterium]